MSTLYVMVGVSGSGKSTWANNLALVMGAVVVSSDAIRGELYGDESIQSDPAKVFEIVHSRVASNLDSGITTIMDATNLSSKRRRALCEKFHNHTCVAVVVPVTLEEAVRRDFLRDRHVGERVIRKQISQFEMVRPNEGFCNIIVVQSNTKVNTENLKAEMDKMNQDNQYHTHTVGKHCDITKELIQKETCCVDDWRVEAALWHDLGKVFTKSFENMKGEVTEVAHYYNHQHWGSYYSLLIPAIQTNKLIKRAQLIDLHMEPFLRKDKIDKFYDSLNNDELVEAIKVLHYSDVMSH